MKRFSIFYFIILALLVILPSCKATDPKIEDIFYAEDQATIQKLTQDGKLYTINEFMDAFMTEKGNYLSDSSLYRTRSYGKGTIQGGDTLYLFSIDTLPINGPGIYIMGRISTDDYGGNFYKSLVIQQVVNNEQQALRISVDAGSISGMYPRGQMILIRCNGLAIGRYANQPQLCVPSYNNNVYADKASQKVGWAPGRIPLARFKKATYFIGSPDESKLVYDVCTIEDLTANYKDIVGARKKDGKLIKVYNIHYSGECTNDQRKLVYCVPLNPDTCKTANVFAPTTKNVGHPQTRFIYDAENSHYIGVSMSEYAKEANYYLPGATAAEEGEVYFYTETFDYSKPYLEATLNGTHYYIQVSARKEYEGWKVDDVIYLDTLKTSGTGFVCTKVESGVVSWSNALGVVHCSEYVGSVRGIWSYYMDNAEYTPEGTNWAISICDLSDLQLYKNGKVWVPIEYTAN